MVLTGFYGVLATTASIFVGILTAYLVTRLSDLKTERSQIKRRIESLDAELETLIQNRSNTVDILQSTEERWEVEQAQDEVDNFIEYDVGSEWSPNPSDIDLEDAANALRQHRAGDDLTHTHLEELRDRWNEIVDELRPTQTRHGMPVELPSSVTTPEEYTAANWIMDALWEIYDRERYDREGSNLSEIHVSINQLGDKREVLIEQYESLNPEQLQNSLRATIVPIVLSVVLPLTVRLLHELGWVINVAARDAWIEPICVFLIWMVGFCWTLLFVWNRVIGTDNDLTDSPLTDTELETPLS